MTVRGVIKTVIGGIGIFVVAFMGMYTVWYFSGPCETVSVPHVIAHAYLFPGGPSIQSIIDAELCGGGRQCDEVFIHYAKRVNSNENISFIGEGWCDDREPREAE
jgi:hypothetical protein